MAKSNLANALAANLCVCVCVAFNAILTGTCTVCV